VNVYESSAFSEEKKLLSFSDESMVKNHCMMTHDFPLILQGHHLGSIDGNIWDFPVLKVVTERSVNIVVHLCCLLSVQK